LNSDFWQFEAFFPPPAMINAEFVYHKQKIKLLYLMEILRQDTDEQHPISTNQICARFAEHGISCERRTVGMDMKVLNDYGYEIRLNTLF